MCETNETFLVPPHVPITDSSPRPVVSAVSVRMAVFTRLYGSAGHRARYHASPSLNQLWIWRCATSVRTVSPYIPHGRPGTQHTHRSYQLPEGLQAGGGCRVVRWLSIHHRVDSGEWTVHTDNESTVVAIPLDCWVWEWPDTSLRPLSLLLSSSSSSSSSSSRSSPLTFCATDLWQALTAACQCQVPGDLCTVPDDHELAAAAAAAVTGPSITMASATPPPSTPPLASTANRRTATPPTLQEARLLAGQLAQQANQVVQQLTVRKYTLPDKNVASQVLMYRQLLHTKCRPGLKLSRDYQATPAQQAVKHMPWWSKGIDETGKMEIAYDNLVRRLWLHGAVLPFAHVDADHQPTFMDDTTGMPPIPHEYWVTRLGFQQTDPVTDFRSGGVLSLAMLVWMVESCPTVHRRFVDGDAAVLPFAITSINITDMMAKFLMLSKAVDRMDALLSQKPFWRMFADPYALLACQELCMDLLADVVVELREIRTAEATMTNRSEHADTEAMVTVFDFAHILAVTERRVEYDLLGSGPGTVEELRAIQIKIKQRYQQQLQSKLDRLRRMPNITTTGPEDRGTTTGTPTAASPVTTTRAMGDRLGLFQTSSSTTTATTPPPPPPPQQLQQQQQQHSLLQQAAGVKMAASNLAGTMLAKFKEVPSPFRTTKSRNDHETEAVLFEKESSAASVSASAPVPAVSTTMTPNAAMTTTITASASPPDLLDTDSVVTKTDLGSSNNKTSSHDDDGGGVGLITASTDDSDWTTVIPGGGITEQVAHFSIGDDDDEPIVGTTNANDDLLL